MAIAKVHPCCYLAPAPRESQPQQGALKGITFVMVFGWLPLLVAVQAVGVLVSLGFEERSRSYMFGGGPVLVLLQSS